MFDDFLVFLHLFLTFLEQNCNCHVEALRNAIKHCEETGLSANDFEQNELEVAKKVLNELELAVSARESLAKAAKDGDVDALHFPFCSWPEHEVFNFYQTRSFYAFS